MKLMCMQSDRILVNRDYINFYDTNLNKGIELVFALTTNKITKSTK